MRFAASSNELIAEYAEAIVAWKSARSPAAIAWPPRPEYHDAVRAFVKSLKPPMKLSLQALETLAVIAYKQPVTAPEVGEIRGVDSSGVLGSLISRKLITTAGRKQVIGRPILYKTTKEFLLRFGLKDLNELPSIEEFEKMAGELAETATRSAHLPSNCPLSKGTTGVDEEQEMLRRPNPDPDEDETRAAAVASVGVSEEHGQDHGRSSRHRSRARSEADPHGRCRRSDRFRGPARRRGLMARGSGAVAPGRIRTGCKRSSPLPESARGAKPRSSFSPAGCRSTEKS